MHISKLHEKNAVDEAINKIEKIVAVTKIKRIETVCQKYFTKLQKMENTQSKIKPIKIGKRPGTTYCFGCKDYTQNFRPENVKMTNKVLREKSHCVVS